MRSDTPLHFAEDFYSSQQKYLNLTKKKDRFTINGSMAKSWTSLKDYLPAVKEQVFALNAHTFTIFSEYILKKLMERPGKQLDEDLKNTKIGEDILTGLLYVIEDGGIQPYHFKTWQKSIDEEDFEHLYAAREYIIVTFNPHKPLSWSEAIDTTTGPKEFDHYNTFIRPIWCYHEAPEEFPLCEEFVRPFLELFIPNEDERNYVIYWLHCLSFQRLNDILVLIGRQGNGKNTLMQLATIVAGRHNTIIGSKAFGKEKFNGEVLRRKLVNLDEYSVKGNAKESLKCFSNDSITVEVKGGDPVQIENHCSFIIANNSMRSTDFEFKDRRFTCPTLNDRDLLLDWPKDRIAAFKSIMKGNAFQIEFPHWLAKEVKEKGLNYPNQMNYITPHFYNLVEAAKPEWFKEFKRQLKYKYSVNTQDIYKATRVRVSDSKLQEELSKEIEEREFRGIKPFELAKAKTEEGKTQYLSMLYKEELDSETTIS